MLQTLFICLSILAAGFWLALAIEIGVKSICRAITSHADRVEASARRLEETIYSEAGRISRTL